MKSKNKIVLLHSFTVENHAVSFKNISKKTLINRTVIVTAGTIHTIVALNRIFQENRIHRFSLSYRVCRLFPRACVPFVSECVRVSLSFVSECLIHFDVNL